MKKSLLKMSIVLIAVLASTFSMHALTIDKQVGWLESAYVTWAPVTDAISYNVYYSGEGVTNKKIDTQLIRSYGTYLRADVVGISAGSYTITVKAVNVSNVEFEEATSSAVTVKSYDRVGYCFWDGRVPGGYKADGTPKDNAVILYVTENTKDTISMNVAEANENPCVGLEMILEGYKKGKETRPLIIRMIGQVTDMKYMDKGDIVIENKENASSYITLEGIGDDATADGWGIRVKNASNIEIRNVGIMNTDSKEGDDIGLQQDNNHVWVHNCDFFYGGPGGDSDQAKGDGALDCKKSTYITFSYNHFWDTGKSNLLGLSGESDDMFITYHHNWYDHSDSRHPRVRYYTCHVYNNYYDGNAKYGVGSTKGSSVFVEGNYFRNCKFPILTSLQGSDLASTWTSTSLVLDEDYGTFSGEDGGSIKAFNNHIEGQKRFVAYGDANFYNSTTHFDAYVVENRNDPMPSSVKSVAGGNTYNNFDTNSALIYSYTADSPDDAKANVMTYAGRPEGGDFKWTFNNAVDDASYAVNAPLKSALMNYKTKMVSIQGEGGEPPHDDGTVTLALTTGDKDQTITLGQSIQPIVFTAGGTATAINVTALPEGLSGNVDNLTLTISGTPKNPGNIKYTVTASDATYTSVSSGMITVLDSAVNATDVQGGLCDLVSEGSSSGFTISGNVSTSKGSVTVMGTTYSCCLKMESSTSITFTTTSEKNLTLYFLSSESGKRVYVDEVSYTADGDGIVKVPLAAGSHKIRKRDTMNLFYISLLSGSSAISEATASATAVYYQDGVVYNPSQEKIMVVNTFGKILYSGTDTKSLRSYPHNIYIIKVVGTNQVQKVVW